MTIFAAGEIQAVGGAERESLRARESQVWLGNGRGEGKVGAGVGVWRASEFGGLHESRLCCKLQPPFPLRGWSVTLGL